MTLRSRLALLTAVTVALVLLGSGVGLHFLLQASLVRGLDNSLRQAATLLSSSVDTEDGRPELDLNDEALFGLRGDLAVLLLNDRGEIVSRLGARLARPPAARLGYGTQGDARVLGMRVPGGTLLVARDLEGVEDSVERFDAAFLMLAPVALLVALLLGYVLAGRGLAPVDRLTRASLDLARRQAWQERLPEPRRQDELWRLARASNTLLAALAELIERERRFTADAAHELRTPLTVLLGRLEQALEGAPDQSTRERLQQAASANEGLLRLTETLLLLSRTEAGHGLTAASVALDEVAFDTAESIRPLFVRAGTPLELNLPEAPVWVSGDAAALGMLVRNLLDNALKFAPAGPVSVTVRVDGQDVLLCVEDRGPGFPAGSETRVFERFYQTSVQHRRTGSGVGLALAISVAQWHGGHLEATNRPGGGARVTLRLPGLRERPAESAGAR